MSNRLLDQLPTNEIRERARGADCGRGDLSPDVVALHAAGWLVACLPPRHGGSGWGSEPAGCLEAFDALRLVGRANLSLARLFEGHMNAVKLVYLHANDTLKSETATVVASGSLLGVWGADVTGNPVMRSEGSGAALLTGVKQFASGLNLVEQAVITVKTNDVTELWLAPTDELERADTATWAMGGMRATQSGRYDFTGIALDLASRLGAPDAYYAEPYFEGGIWRYCAAHLGAAEGIYEAMRDTLIDAGRADDPHQQKRIAECAIALETMRLWVRRAACETETEGALASMAALSLLAREVTETNCLLVMDRAERALGTTAYVEGSLIERSCRDLRLFLRQAAPDAKRAKAVAQLLESGALLEGL